MRIVAIAAASLAVGALALAACGGGGEQKSAAIGTPLETFQIAETDFKLTPSTFTVDKGGTYSFKAVNNGAVTHSLEVEGNGVEAKLPNDLAAGDSGSVTVELEAGTYTMYCPVDGHKDLGMKGEITVGGSAPQMTPTETTGSNGSGYGG